MSSPALARFNPTQPGAAGMKAAATGLLVVMALVLFAPLIRRLRTGRRDRTRNEVTVP